MVPWFKTHRRWPEGKAGSVSVVKSVHPSPVAEAGRDPMASVLVTVFLGAALKGGKVRA